MRPVEEITGEASLDPPEEWFCALTEALRVAVTQAYQPVRRARAPQIHTSRATGNVPLVAQTRRQLEGLLIRTNVTVIRDSDVILIR